MNQIEHMDPKLQSALAALQPYEASIPAADLRTWIESCDLGIDDVEQFCRFDTDHYVRNLLVAGPAFHALVICWRNGQRSPIHDHRSSRCAVRVLKGIAVETNFETAPNGMIYAVSSRQLSEGSTCYSEDCDIHQISNLQAEESDLVTLHIYSPPLMHMNVYSMQNAEVREVFDPINDDFVSGAGI